MVQLIKSLLYTRHHPGLSAEQLLRRPLRVARKRQRRARCAALHLVASVSASILRGRRVCVRATLDPDGIELRAAASCQQQQSAITRAHAAPYSQDSSSRPYPFIPRGVQPLSKRPCHPSAPLIHQRLHQLPGMLQPLPPLLVLCLPPRRCRVGGGG